MYVFLGLRDEESGKVAASNDRVMVEEGSHEDDAVIPNNDDIPTELVISYDKDHPQNGSLYDVPINGRVQVGSATICNQ